jgi:hypothetical protein
MPHHFPAHNTEYSSAVAQSYGCAGKHRRRNALPKGWLRPPTFFAGVEG